MPHPLQESVLKPQTFAPGSEIELPSESRWLGSRLITNEMPGDPELVEEVEVSMSVINPYAQFLTLSEYMVAATPTDFSKLISAMGADGSGFTVAAAQAVGALGVRYGETSVAMVSVYRKLIRNELAARTVIECEGCGLARLRRNSSQRPIRGGSELCASRAPSEHRASCGSIWDQLFSW